MAESKQQQQLKEITERLEKGVKELFTSEKYMEYLRVMSQFHNYSFSNTLLIAMQKPDATLVAGYGAWQKKFERNVMKGEKAIKIFAPAPRKIEVEQDMLDPETQKPVIDENGEVKKETVTVKQPFFKITSVFDVSQTDGKPLPELDTVQDLTGSVEGYNIFFEALKRTSKVPMDFQPIEGESHGFYHQVEKRIAIREGMSEAQNVKTGIHEIAHSRLHDVDMIDAANGIAVDRRTREVQAESVAYTVCQHYGIETSDYSFGYIAGWSEGKEMKELRSSMEVIRREADSMIKEIDRNLEEIRKERQKEAEVTVDAPKSFIESYYVAEDLRERGALNIQKFDDMDAALQAYFELPNDKTKAFGIDKTPNPMPGSLDMLQCINGIDRIVLDYMKVEGWKNPEIIAVADKIDTALDTHDVQLAFEVKDRYFVIQNTDEGYDYTFYNFQYKELDGGVYDNPDLTITEAIEEILADEGLSFEDCHIINHDDFMEEVEKVNVIPIVEAAEPKYTPLYQSYLDVKAEHPDSIVLYQVGDFFEAFNDDAKTIAAAFDLQLTSRPVNDTERAALIGLPQHRLESYMDMIRDRGHDVVLASLENGERKVVPLRSTNKEDPVESQVIGRINYLHTDGKVRESIEYTSEYHLAKDIREESFYGVPMTVDVYADKDGNTIDYAYLSTIDPPLKGVSVIPSPYIEDQLHKLPLTSENTEPSKALNGLSCAEIEETVLAHAQAELDDMGLSDSVKLIGARVYGSRTRDGLYSDASDLDVVLSYSDPDNELLEDSFFNVLNEIGMQIGGLPVDINPIALEETGTLEDYLTRAEAYLDEKQATMEKEQVIAPEAERPEPKRFAVVIMDDGADHAYEVWDMEKRACYVGGDGNRAEFMTRWQAEDFASEHNRWVAEHGGVGAEILSPEIQRENAELDAIGNFLDATHIYDITYGFDNGVFSAKDEDTTWTRSEFYDFLVNDVIMLDENEKLVPGFYMPDKVLEPIIGYAKEVGVTINKHPLEKPEPEKHSIVPLSDMTFAEAREKGEVDAWRASKKETEACSHQFNQEFGMAYHERRMPEFLADMADKYGMERVKIVLASTIQLADHDGRYYPSTKADAAKVHIPGTDDAAKVHIPGTDTEDYSKDIRFLYATNCHPVMVNSAFRELQKMEREQAKTKEPAAVEHDSKPPKASLLSRLQEKQKQVKVSPTKTEDKKRGVEL